MKTLIVTAVLALLTLSPYAQEKKTSPVKSTINSTLPLLESSVLQAQASVDLFVQNLDSNAKENNVNAIILDIQAYIDSIKADKSRSDVLLLKNYAALRLFFLTPTNKTTVATAFLYPTQPYRFCIYDDSLALYVGAVKNGVIYNLSKMTEKQAAKLALLNCLLPSLNALSDFKVTEIKYVGLSVYYGCRDTREGAPEGPLTPFCLTLVARLADIQQYAAGLITPRGLLANSDLFLSDAEDFKTLNRINLKP